MTITESVKTLAAEFPDHTFFGTKQAIMFPRGPLSPAKFEYLHEVSFVPGFANEAHFCKARTIEQATRMARYSLRLGLPEIVELPV
jgi:hypothetical protein